MTIPQTVTVSKRQQERIPGGALGGCAGEGRWHLLAGIIDII